MMMKRNCVCVICGFSLLFAASASRAATFQEMTPQSKAAIKRGVAWLVQNQKPDGSWVTATTRPDHLGLMGRAGLPRSDVGG